MASDALKMNHENDDIAIIGMACRLPGKSNNPKEFWQFLMEGRDGIIDVPANRWDAEAYYDEDSSLPDKMYVKRGGFIDQLDQFDPQFFGISPKEAPHMDPQHRWLLELAYESFENAGLKVSDLKGSDTAVYIGQFMHDFEQIQLDHQAHEGITSHSATGSSMTLTANRISYAFDFSGPSVTLDTACSSSIVALDMACKAILGGDSKLALAGGVNILLRPELTMSICKASMLSPDMKCKSFDASANGYVRSEGAGLVLLKRLSDALRDGDPILALIKATSVNQDGQTAGITVPNGTAQQNLLMKSLHKAGFDSSEIQYAEAHGTGTAVGDPIEVNALGKVFGQRDATIAPCIIGSVKSNIGHTEATAGVAALIKTVMAMKHGIIPKNLHLVNVNPAIDLNALNVRLAAQTTPWPDTKNKTRKAIVNSFGFGGTNANVVLEQAPAVDKNYPSEHSGERFQCLLLSGTTEKALKDNAANYLNYLQQTENTFSDIVFSAATRREHFRYRAVVVGNNTTLLQQGLEQFLSGKPATHFVQNHIANEIKGRKCFVFSGMGTTWIGMGKELYQSEPVFRAAMQRCDAALRTYVDWSLLEMMWQQADPETIHQTYIAQPAIFATQVALAAMLADWGIRPDAVVGHSAGEVAAAYVAGALSFDDAVKVILHRSRLQHTTEGMGKMLAVALSVDALQPYILGHENQISIAAINSEDALTLSGEADVLAEIATKLDELGVFARFLKVEVPYHSPVMEHLKPALLDALTSIQAQIPHTPLYSTVSGELTQGNDWSASYWLDNVREPVLFQRAIEQIAMAGFDTFIEVAPHAALASSIKKNLERIQLPGRVVTTMRRDHNDALLLQLCIAELHVVGVPLDWHKLIAETANFVDLPNYAWQHASYWHEAEQVQQSRLNNTQGRNGFLAATHPLLGCKLNSLAAIWQTEVDLRKLPFLADHQLEQDVVYPGAAYVEIGLSLAKTLDLDRVTLEELYFHRALFLDQQHPMTMECTLDRLSQSYQIAALSVQNQQWHTYSSGTISEQAPRSQPTVLCLADLKQKMSGHFDKNRFYQHCHQLGLTYQERFQAVVQAWHTSLESLVELQLPASIMNQYDTYILHPSILDGAFQGLFATIQSAYLPVKIGRLHYYQKPPAHCFAYLVMHEKSAELIRGDICIVDEHGTVMVELQDVEVKSSKTQTNFAQTIPLYDYRWEKQVLATNVDPEPGTWLIFADKQGVSKRLAAELEKNSQTVILIESGASFDQTAPHRFSVNLDTPEYVLPILQQFATTSLGIVYCWAIDSQGCDCHDSTIAPLALVQALDQVNWAHQQRVFFVTQAAQQVENEITRAAAAALWGFARVFANEHLEYRVTLLDIDVAPDDAMVVQLSNELRYKDYEQEVALRKNGRFAHRLRQLQHPTIGQYLKHHTQQDNTHPYQYSLANGHITATEFVLPMITDDEVRLQVDYASLDAFSLIAWKAGKVLPSQIECSGSVLQIGKNVKHLKVGDQVFGFAQQEYAAQVNANSKHLIVRPIALSSELAAVLPAALIGAQYCLQQLARVNTDSRVLIHNATSLFGQIALRYAQEQGASVFVSAASLIQREQLQQQGVAAVFDSTSDHFVTELMQLTEGQGVNLILNTLSGQLRLKTLDVLCPFGHFIDIDLPAVASDLTWNHKLASLAASYHGFHLESLLQLAPQQVSTSLSAAIQCVGNDLKIAAINATPISDTEIALENDVKCSSLGKLALDFTIRPQQIQAGILENAVRSDASYLVTGGLGGLGLEMMQWLADQGAKSIVLLGRSNASAAALTHIESVRSGGVIVTVLTGDISVECDVARVFDMIAEKLPPLAGILHSAGVLDDATLMQQTPEKFARVLAPKVAGSWYLHQHSCDLHLDFFVLFSSIAAVVGWPGQSNYAAANAFMDSLAQHRRALGLAALSINWGPWSGSGMAASLDEQDRARMQEAGMNTLNAEQGLQAMMQSLAYRLPQAGIFDLDWSLIFKSYPEPGRLTVFKDFISQHAELQRVDLLDELRKLAPFPQATRLAQEIAHTLAEVLDLDNANDIDPTATVFEYGLNSLMGMDFKNRLQSKLRVKLPTTLVLKYPTIHGMVQFILDSQLLMAVPCQVSEKGASNPEQRITLVL